MVYGTKFWNDSSRYSKQNNNPTEEALRIQLAEAGTKYGFTPKGAEHLESCGPTAAINCIDAVRKPFAVLTPGGFELQGEEVLSDYFHDSRNYAELKKAVGEGWFDPEKIPANRVAKCYPLAMKKVFGFEKCSFLPHRPAWEAILGILKANTAIQICLVVPGHFIAIKAIDGNRNELLYNDPWDGRAGAAGFNRTMTKAEYESNTKDYCLLYQGD